MSWHLSAIFIRFKHTIDLTSIIYNKGYVIGPQQKMPIIRNGKDSDMQARSQFANMLADLRHPYRKSEY